MANHGFPEIPPGMANWQHQWNYEFATETIRDFGVAMNTDPSNGTTRGAWYVGLVGPFFLPNTGIIPTDKFTVTMYAADGGYWPLLQNLAEASIFHNGLAALCHGWYDTLQFGGDLYISRDGGHCLAVRAMERTLSGFTLELRDPWSDADVLYQSAFSTSMNTVSTVAVCTGVPPFCYSRVVNKLIPEGFDDSVRYFDCYLSIIPKSGYTWDDSGDQILMINPGYLTYTGPSITPIQVVGEPLDIVITPDQNRFVIAGDGEIRVLDPLSGEETSFVTPSMQNPMAVGFNRLRNLYVLDEGGQTLILVDFDADEPEEELARDLPCECRLLTPDDANDEIVLLSPTDSKLVRLPWHLDAIPEEHIIPAGVPLSGHLHMCLHPADGSLIVCSDEFDGITKLEEPPFGGIIIPTTYEHPELVNPQGMDVDDSGLIYTSVDGIIKVFRITDTDELELVPDAPMAGMEAGAMLRVTHSRTNYDESIHGVPEWLDVPPEEDPVEHEDCLADIEPVDGDGVVDVADLLELLAAWGPCPGCHADIVDDNVVDVADLLELLAAWGPC
jgi:hypothetical protein